jgi:hypothetical protein
MSRKDVSRREFLRKGARQGATLAGMAAVTGSETVLEAQRSTSVDRHTVVAALGDTLVPSTPDPGYKSLEHYNITTEVLKGLAIVRDSDLESFNEGSRPFFGDKTFLQLSEDQREKYLELIIDGSQIEDARLLRTLLKVYRLTRSRVFSVYYQNYPEHIVQRDENDVPILPEGDEHQITNPNTNKIVTGWDIAGYEPQLSWEHEEERRARAKKLGHWIES